MQNLLTLLQINDSMFPIGGFTHSYGLESFVHSGQVHDNASAEAYARSMLVHNIYYNDAAFLNRLWQIGRGKNYWEKVSALDALATALKAPSEIRQASKKLAIRFLKLTMELKPYKPVGTYLENIQAGVNHGHYAIAFGMYAKCAGISREVALEAFYYNTLNAIITNCVKLVPLSQTAGQKTLFKMRDVITTLVAKQNDVDDNLIGLCCIGQEVKCMQHEKLHTRLYIS